MNNKTFNILSIVAVCIAVVGLSVAFAALNTTLTISGTSKLKQASWDINFGTPTGVLTSATARFVDMPVGGSVEGAPTVTGTTLSFNAELDVPGDYIEFTVPVNNDGTLDAILSTVTTSITGIDSDLLVLSVDDESATPLANGSVTLNGGATENITIRAAYDTDILPGDLPVADRTISIEITLLWEQN